MLVGTHTGTDEHDTDISYSQVTGELHTLKTGRLREYKWANGITGGGKASNTYRECNAGLSGHPPANLIHNLNMWTGATGRGCVVCSAWLWHKVGWGCWGSGGGGGGGGWITFPVHKVNVSNSRVTEGVKRLTLKHIRYTRAFNTVQSRERRIEEHTPKYHTGSLLIYHYGNNETVCLLSSLRSDHFTSPLCFGFQLKKTQMKTCLPILSDELASP